jgi:lipoate-protein ligase A
MPVPAVSSFSLGRWRVERWSGDLATFLERSWPQPVAPTVSVVRVDRPALVLGSTQPPDVVDGGRAEEAGVEVLRRHSGGGAVLLHPGRVAWVDVFIPAGDDLWNPDLVRSFAWLGQVWVDALADLGVAARMKERPGDRGRWQTLACFASTGAGEVTVAGRKVVGISQRRSRLGSRFQCAALLGWDAARTAALLALAPADQRRLAGYLLEAAAGLGRSVDEVEDAVLARLAVV